MKTNISIGLFIGRFQPFHNEHYEICKYILNNFDYLVIIIGSSRSARTIRNPFSLQERKEMILSCFSKEEQKRIIISDVQDYIYSESQWITDIQKTIKSILQENNFNQKNCNISLVGYKKDFTSNYLESFPQWNFINYKNGEVNLKINSTKIRNLLFESENHISYINDDNLVPEKIYQFLLKWIKTENFKELQNEYKFIQKYKECWNKAPYLPTFVTTDAVVYQLGHILMIKRKINPGKNKYALPGGFLQQNEKLIDCVIRELKEETKINLSNEYLKKSIIDNNVFDDPFRDFRGRTITHAYLFQLNKNKLLEVIGSDDAKSAEWLTFKQIDDLQENIYSDHYHIIKYFLGRV